MVDGASGQHGARRVLVTGMGGEIGSLVAARLELEPWVGALVGIDLAPPRQRLRRAEFHLVSPHDRRRTGELVRAFDPEVIVHAGVYEPGARSSDGAAAARSVDVAAGVFTAAAGLGHLRSIVVRSGLEVYGRGRQHADAPDESVKPRPTSHFGRILHDVESAALAAGRDAHAPVARLRLGPIVGPHIPSPLGRLLRLPAVPFQPGGRNTFTVVHLDDAVAALAWAAFHRFDGPLNVSGPDALHPLDALRLGRRVPVPTAGIGWRSAALVANAFGAPVPEHVVELLRRGRLADCSAAAAYGLPMRPVRATVADLYAWPSVTRTVPSALRAAS
jgi:UDP-glucose 4-epimerase